MKTRFRFERLTVWQKARQLNRQVKQTAALNRSLEVNTTKTPFARKRRTGPLDSGLSTID